MEEGDDNGIFMCIQHYRSKVCFMIRQSKITNKQISKYCRLQSSRPISLILTHRRILFGGHVSFRLQWAFHEQWPVLHPGVHWQRRFKLFSFFNMQTWASKASSRKLVLSWCLCDVKTTHTKKNQANWLVNTLFIDFIVLLVYIKKQKQLSKTSVACRESFTHHSYVLLTIWKPPYFED